MGAEQNDEPEDALDFLLRWLPGEIPDAMDDDLRLLIQDHVAAAKALVRTPGTVEVCERHGYTMECADYVGREERPKFCSAAKCPLRSQQGKVNT